MPVAGRGCCAAPVPSTAAGGRRNRACHADRPPAPIRGYGSRCTGSRSSPAGTGCRCRHPWARRGREGPARGWDRRRSRSCSDHDQPVPARGHLHVGRVPRRGDEPAHTARAARSTTATAFSPASGDIERPPVGDSPPGPPASSPSARPGRAQRRIVAGEPGSVRESITLTVYTRGVGGIQLNAFLGLAAIADGWSAWSGSPAGDSRIVRTTRWAPVSITATERPVQLVTYAVGRGAVERHAERIARRPQVDGRRNPPRVRVDDRHLSAPADPRTARW